MHLPISKGVASYVVKHKVIFFDKHLQFVLLRAVEDGYLLKA